jgi:hypothetical protein
MLGHAHVESHAGKDAGGLKRNTNVFNVAFNANKGSTLKYDPVNQAEMMDRAVSSFINDFGVLKNKGMTDKEIGRFLGKSDKVSIKNYKKAVAGWENLYKPTYPWNQD